MEIFPYSIIGPHGEVIASGTTTDRALIDGERVLDRLAPPAHWWDASRDTFVPIGAQPSPGHVWDWPRHAWVDGLDVDGWRRQKWLEVKAERDRRIAAGVAVEGLGVFDADERACAAVQAQLALLDSRPPGWSIRWTLHAASSNVAVELGALHMRRVAEAVLGHAPAMHAVARELRDRLQSHGATVGELIAIRWPDPP